MNAVCSACHWVVSRVITDGDSPAELPKNSVNAGVKSPVDSPCRYSSGSTSATLGLLRHHGGTIELLNVALAPVSGSTRAVIDSRRSDLHRARHRGDRARSSMTVTGHQPVTVLITFAQPLGDVGVGLGLQ